MIRSYEQYRDLALRSIKPHDNKDMAILDWTTGLGGEAGEVLELLLEVDPTEEANKMLWAKEIGDILWYSIALAEELNLGEKASQYVADADRMLLDAKAHDVTLHLVWSASQVLEAIKHYVFHKEQAAIENVEIHLGNVYRTILTLCDALDISVKDVATLNAGKLAHRFNLKDGGQFTVAGSKARHASEVAFEDTATYKRVYANITQDVVDISDDDLEVL